MSVMFSICANICAIIEASSTPAMALWANCFAFICEGVRPVVSTIVQISSTPAALAALTRWWPETISIPLSVRAENGSDSRRASLPMVSVIR